MRNVSIEGLRQLLAEDMSSFWVFGIVLQPNPEDPNKDNMVANTYLTANTEDIEAPVPYPADPENPEIVKYTAFPMEIGLASDQEDTVPQAKIKIDNLSREMAYIIRSTDWPPTIILQVFRIKGDKSEVTLELGPARYVLLSATITEATMEGVLGYEGDYLNEPASHAKFTPTVCPGLF